MSSDFSDGQIAAVRAFNRFYTRKLGVLDQQLLKSPFSLSEARVLYELAHREDAAAKEIGIELGLDPGYLSRIIQKFDEDGLITRKPLPADRRQYRLGLTARGRQAFARLERSSHDDVAAMLAALPPGERARLVGAMAAIERLLGEPGAPTSARDPARAIAPAISAGSFSGMARSMRRNMAGISRSKALAAEIAAQFLTSYDPSREHCWIAEIDGEPIGSVFLVRPATMSPNCACLLVDQAGRGQGLGRRLAGQCIALRASLRLSRSRCGPRAFWSPPAGSISAPACAGGRPSRTIVSA